MNPERIKYLGVQTGLGNRIVAELWNVQVWIDGREMWPTFSVFQGQNRELVLAAKAREFIKNAEKARQENRSG